MIDSNPLSNASSVGFTFVAAACITLLLLWWHPLLLLRSKLAAGTCTRWSSPDIDLEDLAVLPTSPPLNSMLDSQLGVFSILPVLAGLKALLSAIRWLSRFL